MLEQPADVVPGHVGQAGIALLVVEEGLAARSTGSGGTCMPDPLSWKIGLGMKVTVLPCSPGGVLDDVLEERHLVGRAQQRVVAHVDLGLAGGAHLVVLHLDVDARPRARRRVISERRSGKWSVGGTGK